MAQLVKVGSNFVKGAVGAFLTLPDASVGAVTMTPVLKDVTTTGSMSAGDNVLTVVDASGIDVGDDVVVLNDGAPGAGARGTRGVGGEWPYMRYATAAKLLSITSLPRNTYAWSEDDGQVYLWYPSWAGSGSPYENAWYTVQSTDYFNQKACPGALLSRVQAKAGNVLTLTVGGEVAVTNSTVIVDNTRRMQAAIDGVGAGGVVIVPSGHYAMGNASTITAENVTITGEDFTDGTEPVSQLWSPPGCPGVQFLGANTPDNVHITKLSLYGNGNETGYGYMRTGANKTTTLPQTNLVNITSITGMQVSHCWFTDWFQSAVQGQYNYQWHWHHNKIIRSAHGFRTYTQWALDAVDGSYGIMEYNECDSPELVTAFEFFREAHSIMRYNTSRNGIYSHNAAGDSYWLDNSLTIEADSKQNTHVTVTQGISVSLNVSPPASGFSTGSTIEGFTLVVEGPTFGDGTDDNSRTKGINIDAPCVNMTLKKCSLTYTGVQAKGIWSSSTGTLVDGCEVYGTDGSSHATSQANIWLQNDGEVRNTTCRTVPSGSTGGSIDAFTDGGGNVAEFQTYG